MITNRPSIAIVPQQLVLRLPLPRIIGPVEFREFCALWRRVEELLRAGPERDFVTRCVQRKVRTRPMTAAEQARFQLESQRALRCTLARALLRESLREFSCHLAESAVLQSFCLIGDLEAVRIPGHSQLQRYQYWLPEAEMRAVIMRVTQQAQGMEAPITLGLAEPVDVSTAYADSTCAEVDIHYPVDWVLLRDAVRTLIQAVVVLREHGLKHRMPEPASFQRQMNRLCIRMTHSGKGDRGKQRRKAVLREMKRVVQAVQAHAARYVWLVEAMPSPQGWAVAARRRMQRVLEQLPAVLHQAHERIIGERQVAAAQKVLSLQEPDAAVITRGKAGARVEFGHSLFVVEQREGLIVDWAMPQTPQTDGALLEEGIARWQQTYGQQTIRTVVTDRGFDGSTTRLAVQEAGLTDSMCPRSARRLAERMEDPAFRAHQRRRAQTEGRIAILKQTFLGGRLHTKGYAHHATEVAWIIFAHNLWVLARLPVAREHRLAA